LISPEDSIEQVELIVGNAAKSINDVGVLMDTGVVSCNLVTMEYEVWRQK